MGRASETAPGSDRPTEATEAARGAVRVPGACVGFPERRLGQKGTKGPTDSETGLCGLVRAPCEAWGRYPHPPHTDTPRPGVWYPPPRKVFLSRRARGRTRPTLGLWARRVKTTGKKEPTRGGKMARRLKSEGASATRSRRPFPYRHRATRALERLRAELFAPTFSNRLKYHVFPGLL